MEASSEDLLPCSQAYAPLRVLESTRDVVLQEINAAHMWFPMWRMNLVVVTDDHIFLAAPRDSNRVLSFRILRGGPEHVAFLREDEYVLGDDLEPHINNLKAMVFTDGSKLLLTAGGRPNGPSNGTLGVLPISGPARKDRSRRGSMLPLGVMSAWGLDALDNTDLVAVSSNSHTVLLLRLSYELRPSGARFSVERLHEFRGHTHNIPCVAFGLRVSRGLTASRRLTASSRVLYSASLDASYILWDMDGLSPKRYPTYESARTEHDVTMDCGWALCSLSKEISPSARIVSKHDPLWRCILHEEKIRCHCALFRLQLDMYAVHKRADLATMWSRCATSLQSTSCVGGALSADEGTENDSLSQDFLVTYDDGTCASEFCRRSPNWNHYPWSDTAPVVSGTSHVLGKSAKPKSEMSGKHSDAELHAASVPVVCYGGTVAQVTDLADNACSRTSRRINPFHGEELFVLGQKKDVSLHRVFRTQETGEVREVVELHRVRPFPKQLRGVPVSFEASIPRRITQIEYLPELDALVVVQQCCWIAVIRIVARPDADVDIGVPAEDPVGCRKAFPRLALIVERVLIPTPGPVVAWMTDPKVSGIGVKKRISCGGRGVSYEVFVVVSSSPGHARIKVIELTKREMPVLETIAL